MRTHTKATELTTSSSRSCGWGSRLAGNRGDLSSAQSPRSLRFPRLTWEGRGGEDVGSGENSGKRSYDPLEGGV